MINDLKIIKKKYGEEMMYFCREAFATILETPGVLSNLLLTYFEPSKELFSDLEKSNLKASFKAFIYRKFNKFEIPSYERDNNGKYYKYNYEINGISYCPNNCILVNHEAIKFPKDRYILADYFIIDRQEKTITAYDNIINDYDSFSKFFQDNPISTIDLEIENDIKIVKIETSKGLVTLELDKENRIIGLINPYIEEIGGDFLRLNKYLTKIELPQVNSIGYGFLEYNQNLKEISLPNVEKIGHMFLHYNEILTKINLPNVRVINGQFLINNLSLTEISLPKVEIIGSMFLYGNEILTKINLPNVINIEECFLNFNKVLTEISLPNVETIDSCFLQNNKVIERIYMPNLIKIKSDFLGYFAKNPEEVIINNEEVYQEFLRQHPEYQEKTLTRKLTNGSR